ncbi:MAG: hypothetical protein ACHQHN_03435 [Sphingobacteriales bacterium]
MTYQQYYNKLVKHIADSEIDISEQQKILKGEKGYLDQQNMFAYMSLWNDLYSLKSECGALLKLITTGTVNGGDEIDAARLPNIKDI